MASISEQRSAALTAKLAGELRLSRMLVDYVNDVVRSYRIGQSTISEDSITVLSEILKKANYITCKSVLGFDLREYKQEPDENILESIYSAIALKMFDLSIQHQNKSLVSIVSTTTDHISKVSNLAAPEQWSPREAKAALRNYVNNQRLTIAVTETQWTVETARNTAVITVNDPLKNSVARVVEYIEGGDYNSARRLSRQVMKLAKLPLSVSQGDLVRTISDNRDRLLTPITQGEAIANVRKKARALDKRGKQWETIGDSKVRESHINANGQTKEVEEAFEVGGSLLQYPGDGSLGAPLAEIINCRCVSAYM